jgi:PhzF family phenazine biosynthesis protein
MHLPPPVSRPFQQVDVFTAKPYFGNALAVVLDSTGLSDAQMQRFAQWTNLAETTFLLPPTADAQAAGADYQVRIFTTAYEMPFAGHPTLGSCHAWLAHGGVPQNPARIVQQCKIGLVPLQHQGTRLAFAAPALQRSAIDAALLAPLLSALGLQVGNVLASQHLVNGPRYFGLLLDNAQTVLDLAPDFAAVKAVLAQGGCSGVGVAAVAPDAFDAHDASSGRLILRSNREARAFGGKSSASATGSSSTSIAASSAHVATFATAFEQQPSVEVRMFVSDLVVAEDPITGSFNASLAQWLIADGHAPSSYVAAQGSCIGRAGRLHITQDASGQVWVGGDSVTCVDGSVLL